MIKRSASATGGIDEYPLLNAFGNYVSEKAGICHYGLETHQLVGSLPTHCMFLPIPF
jgi:hypothetical protein